MGTWSCTEITTARRDRTRDLYGHFMDVTFTLRYRPSLIGGFREMPRLEWKEVITLLDHERGQVWTYAGDQYARNAKSMTFFTWYSRYVLAYDSVAHPAPGPVQLLDSLGRRLPRDRFAPTPDPDEKVRRVRRFLSRQGGIVRITVTDTPAINRPRSGRPVHKERLLTFDCGLRGMGRRVRAWQYLRVTSDRPEHTWSRRFQFTHDSPLLEAHGFERVPPPINVSMVKTPHFGRGEVM